MLLFEWPRRKCLVKTTFQLLGRNYIVKRTICHRADSRTPSGKADGRLSRDVTRG